MPTNLLQLPLFLVGALAFCFLGALGAIGGFVLIQWPEKDKII